MIRILAVLLAALALSGCSESPQEAIVGTWFDAEDDSTVQFFDDGRILVDDGPLQITGKYRLLDENRMSLDLTQGDSEPVSVVVGYELDGNALTLIAPDGDTTKMTRTSR